MRGQKVCASHGGRAPQNKRAAQRLLVKREIDREFAKLGVAPIDDPMAAFEQLTAEVVAMKDFMAVRVAELKTLRYDGAAGEQLRAEVALYERALDRSHKLLVDWIRIKERAGMTDADGNITFTLKIDRASDDAA